MAVREVPRAVRTAPADAGSRSAPPPAPGADGLAGGGRRRSGRLTWAGDLAFVAFCAAVAAARFAVLVDPAAPAGVDSGNWLALGRDLLGDPIRSRSIVYPPLVPLLVTGAVGALGLVRGVAVVTAVTALLPAAGLYVAMRVNGLTWAAGVLAGLVLTASATGEAAAWGGFPQLISFGLLTVGLLALDRWLRSGGRGRAVAVGVVLALLLATSHLVALVAMVSGLALLGLHLALRPGDGPAWRRLLSPAAALVVLPSLPVVPTYLALVGGIRHPTARAGGLELRPDNLVENLDFLFRDFAGLWRVLVTLACLTPLALVRCRRTSLWMMSTSLLLGTALAAGCTRQPRYLYTLPLAAVLALALWVGELAHPAAPMRQRAVVGVVLAGALTAQTLLGLHFFRVQRDYYGVLTPGGLAGLEWLRDRTAPAATVAVTTAKDDLLLGWWVEGVARRRTLYATDPVWLNFEDELARAKRAQEVFEPGFPGPATFDRARRRGVDYLFVAKTWPGYDATAVEAFRTLHPAAFVYENGSVLVLAVPAPVPERTEAQ